MNKTEKLTQKKAEILKKIASLGPLRKGSVTEQFLETKQKDGSNAKRGPYLIYTFKEKGKTKSRRIKEGEQARIYRQQIAAFRRYRELSNELVRASQKIADLAAAAETKDEKKPLRNNRGGKRGRNRPDTGTVVARKQYRL